LVKACPEFIEGETERDLREGEEKRGASPLF
jgi:hypothetical protein